MKGKANRMTRLLGLIFLSTSGPFTGSLAVPVFRLQRVKRPISLKDRQPLVKGRNIGVAFSEDQTKRVRLQVFDTHHQLSGKLRLIGRTIGPVDHHAVDILVLQSQNRGVERVIGQHIAIADNRLGKVGIGGIGLCRQLLASLEVIQRQAGILSPHQNGLAVHQIGFGEVHRLLALVRDRDTRGHQIKLPLFQGGKEIPFTKKESAQ